MASVRRSGAAEVPLVYRVAEGDAGMRRRVREDLCMWGRRNRETSAELRREVLTNGATSFVSDDLFFGDKRIFFVANVASRRPEGGYNERLNGR